MQPFFPGSTLRSIIAGDSAVDVPRLQVRDLASADAFLEGYGYPPESGAEVDVLRDAAVAFVERSLLDPGEHIVAPVREQHDVRQLLIWASTGSGAVQSWSCALLRVMHAYAHARSFLAERYGGAIHEQISARFDAHIVHDPLRLGRGSDAVPLVAFEARSPKTIEAVVMKLLHKRESVAIDVFDRVGVRFVTPTRFDALLVVRFLRAHHVTMFANITPSRSRNTLISMPALEAALSEVEGLDVGAQLERLREVVDGALQAPADNANRFTASDYRSIQYTARQLIRVEAGGVYSRFFFPFEVQIIDAASLAEARSGRASHAEYKSRQRAAVRARVLRVNQGQ